MPSRCSVGPATPVTSPPSATCAKPRSPRSLKAPTRSNGSSSPVSCSAAEHPSKENPLQINVSTVALVTGGASGLGEATTRRLHEGGAAVVILDLPSAPGEALAAELGAKVRFCAADVRNEAQVQAAIAAAQELGDLRIVVNCAGVG